MASSSRGAGSGACARLLLRLVDCLLDTCDLHVSTCGLKPKGASPVLSDNIDTNGRQDNKGGLEAGEFLLDATILLLQAGLEDSKDNPTLRPESWMATYCRAACYVRSRSGSTCKRCKWRPRQREPIVRGRLRGYDNALGGRS